MPPHPSKLVDEPRKRINVDEVPPPDRTPAQMLGVLTKIVNRKVETLNRLTKDGAVSLDPMYDDELAKLVDLVCKLAREERASEVDLSNLTNEQLLALQQQQKLLNGTKDTE